MHPINLGAHEVMDGGVAQVEAGIAGHQRSQGCGAVRAHGCDVQCESSMARGEGESGSHVEGQLTHET